MDSKYLQTLFTKQEESQNKRIESKFIFYKRITTLATGLIGLLISLRPDEIDLFESKVLFQLSILLIGLCILSSLGVQFYEVTYYNKVDKIRQKHIQEYIRDPDDNYIQVERLPKILALKIFEIMTLLCLSLSILTLIAYSFSIDF